MMSDVTGTKLKNKSAFNGDNKLTPSSQSSNAMRPNDNGTV